MLAHEGRDLLIMFRVTGSFFCRNLAFCWMFKAFVTVLENKNLCVTIRSCVQFRWRWQAIIREGFRIQNAIFKSCTVHLNIIASWRTPDIHSLIWR